MKETRMPPAHAANLVANSGNALYHTQNTTWDILSSYPISGWFTSLDPTPLWHGWLLAD